MSEPRRRRSGGETPVPAYDLPVVKEANPGRDLQKRTRARAKARIVAALIIVAGLRVGSLGGSTVYALANGLDPFAEIKQARNGYYKIVNDGSGLVLGVKKASPKSTILRNSFP